MHTSYLHRKTMKVLKAKWSECLLFDKKIFAIKEKLVAHYHGVPAFCLNPIVDFKYELISKSCGCKFDNLKNRF
jgi:hypothetical protein